MARCCGLLSRRAKVHSVIADARVEVQRYLKTPYVNRASDPLEFWAKHQTFFPHLFNITQKYLSIPATSVPCERVFSKAGEILCKKRNRLNAKTLEQILFFNKNSMLFCRFVVTFSHILTR